MNEPVLSEKKAATSGFLLALLAVVLWSGNFIAARALRGNISPVSLAFFRWFIATLVLFPFAVKSVQKEWPLFYRHRVYLSLTALAGVTVFNTLVYVAGRYTTATNLALIGTTASPVFVFVLSAVFLGQKLSLNQYLGIAFCLTGILILLSGGQLQTLQRFHFTEGDLWILGAGFSFAVYTILVKQKPVNLSSTSFLFALFFLGTLFLLPVFFINLRYEQPVVWSGALIGSILYLGICASVFAFLAWNLSIKKLGAPRTALFGNLIPVFSTVEAAWLLDESITAVTLLSFAIIFIGILVANLQLIQSMRRKNVRTA